MVVLPRSLDAPRTDENRGNPLMNLLEGHVPISLIMDLAMPSGPHSDELLQAEAEQLGRRREARRG